MQTHYDDGTVGNIQALTSGRELSEIVAEVHKVGVKKVVISGANKRWPTWKIECRIVKSRRDRPKRRRKRKAARLARRCNR